MDEVKKQMIDDAKRQINKQFEGDHVNIDIINIYDDASGLSGLRHMRCSCCSSEVFDDTLRDNIQKYFALDDQKEIALHFVRCLIRYYDLVEIESMSKETREHLHKVLEYLWKDEQRHYEECDEEGRDNHIFVSMKAVNDWISQ